MTRDECISILEEHTQIDRIELKSKTNEELKDLYMKRVLNK